MSATVPILMYHKVGAPVNAPADRFLNVDAGMFARQVGLLARLGYRGVTFDEAMAGLAGERTLPRRAVCVTFDDGYTCVADAAAPALAAAGWPATVFVPTDYVGAENGWDRAEGKPVIPIMGWERLAALCDAGWEASGHTRSHPRLSRLADDDAVAEIRGGADLLAERLSRPVTTFCYPFGDMGPDTPALVRRAGLRAACTTKSGLARAGGDPYRVPRVKIATRDGLAGFLYRLWIRPRLGAPHPAP